MLLLTLVRRHEYYNYCFLHFFVYGYIIYVRKCVVPTFRNNMFSNNFFCYRYVIHAYETMVRDLINLMPLYSFIVVH